MLFMQAALFGQEIDTLDRALNDSMTYIIDRLEPGTKVAVLNFSASPGITNYVIEEITAFLVNNSNLTVVDRSELELLQGEMNFQLSGDVSDESAQSIGKKLGAQTVLSGSLTPFGKLWRMRIRALEVETARVQGVRTYTIKKDRVLRNFIPKTPGENVGTGALNIFLGLGSYLEGDLAGGLTITAGYAVMAGLCMVEAVALDWDSPAVGIPVAIGVATAGLTIVYGFIRPFIYNRNQQLTVAVLDNVRLNVVPTAEHGFETPRRPGFQLAYSLKF
jgi:TolB-like protein